MKKVIILSFVLLTGYISYAQNIDSLKLALNTAKDTARVNTLNRLSRAYQYIEIKELLRYALEAKTLSEKLKYKSGLSSALNCIGVYYASIGEDKKALVFLRNALKIADPKDLYAQVAILSKIGATEYEFNTRLKYLNKALALAKKINYQRIGFIYRSLGNTYYNNLDNIKAFECYKEGVKASETNHDTLAIALNLECLAAVLDTRKDINTLDIYNKGLVMAEKIKNKFLITIFKNALTSYYWNNGKPDTALIIGHQALTMAKELNDKIQISIAYKELAHSFKLLHKNDKALEYFNHALNYIYVKDEDTQTAEILSEMGAIYASKGQYDLAINHLKEAERLCKKLQADQILIFVYRNLSEAFINHNDHKEALRYYKLSNVIEDSIYALEKVQQLASLNTKYEVEKKEQAIKILKQNNSIKDLKLAQSNTKFIVMIGLCIFILLLTALVYNQYRIKRKANVVMHKANEEILSMVREKEVLVQEIHHRVKNNLQLVSSLLKWQTEDVKDEQLLKILGEGQSRIKSMAMIHEALYQSGNFVDLNLNDYLNKLLDYLQKIYSKKDKAIYITKSIEHVYLDIEVTIPLGLIVTEIVSNAFKYAFEAQEGHIDVSLNEYEPDLYRLVIRDNGIGFPDKFMVESNIKTMGMQLVKILIKQIKGKLEITNNRGAVFTILFSNINYRKISLATYANEYAKN